MPLRGMHGVSIQNKLSTEVSTQDHQKSNVYADTHSQVTF